LVSIAAISETKVPQKSLLKCCAESELFGIEPQNFTPALSYETSESRMA